MDRPLPPLAIWVLMYAAHFSVSLEPGVGVPGRNEILLFAWNSSYHYGDTPSFSAVLKADAFHVWTVLHTQTSRDQMIVTVCHVDAWPRIQTVVKQANSQIRALCYMNETDADTSGMMQLHGCDEHVVMTSINQIVMDSELEEVELVTDDEWLTVPDDVPLLDWSCNSGVVFPREGGEETMIYVAVMTVIVNCPPGRLPEVLTPYETTHGDFAVLMQPILTVLQVAGSAATDELTAHDIPLDDLAGNVYRVVEVTQSDRQCSYSLLVAPGEEPSVAGLECGSSSAVGIQSIDRSSNLTNWQTLLPVQLEDSLDSVFRGFHGRQMLVATLEYEPFVSIEVVNGTKVYSGHCMDLLDLLAEMLDFTFVYVDYIADFGILLNGAWTGSIRATIEGDVDFIMTGLTITGQREEVIDYSYPFWEEPLAMITLLQPPDPFMLFKPLHVYVWALFLGLGLCVAFMVYALEHYFMDRDSIETPERGMHQFSESLWYFYGSCFNLGGQYCPESGSGRVITSAFWMVSVVLIATYLANRMAFLAVTQGVLPFQTLQEVADDRTHLMQVANGTITVTLFQTSEDGVFKDLWEKINWRWEESIMPNMTAALDIMFGDGPYVPAVYTTDLTLLIYEARRHGICNWGIIPEKYFPSGFGIAMPQGTPFKPAVDDAIRSMTEYGILTRLREQYLSWLSEDSCGSDVTASAQSMTLNDIWAGFLVLGIGLAVSLGVLFGEISMWRGRTKGTMSDRWSRFTYWLRRKFSVYV